jgi:predicted Rossmann-fold nucleotide-binding protein
MSQAHKAAGGPGERKAPLVAGMPLRFGVMGSAGGDVPHEYLEKAFTLGQAIARRGCVLVTGACPGLPLAAAGGARLRSSS